MSVLVSNRTPYSLWRVDGGLVGACRTYPEARTLIIDLKTTFPDKHYVCRNEDDDLVFDTRAHDWPLPNPHGAVDE